MIGLFTLLLFIPIARSVVLSFGSSEFFLLTVLGLAAIAVSVKGKLLRGLVAACIGLLLAFVGANQFSGEHAVHGRHRLSVGRHTARARPDRPVRDQPDDRAGAEGRIGRRRRVSGGGGEDEDLGRRLGESIAVFRHWPVLLRGSLIGTVIGAIPGLGGTVAAFLSYSSTAQTAKDRDTFGKGNIKGVIAPEAANNAKDGGSLIPTVAFGIPGSAETAIFLGILVLHGIEPGPSILIQNEREIYGLIVALTVSAIGASVLGLLFSRDYSSSSRGSTSTSWCPSS